MVTFPRVAHILRTRTSIRLCKRPGQRCHTPVTRVFGTSACHVRDVPRASTGQRCTPAAVGAQSFAGRPSDACAFCMRAVCPRLLDNHKTCVFKALTGCVCPFHGKQAPCQLPWASPHPARTMRGAPNRSAHGHERRLIAPSGSVPPVPRGLCADPVCASAERP